jgi:hypothetical protein
MTLEDYLARQANSLENRHEPEPGLPGHESDWLKFCRLAQVPQFVR